jgi:hypothetical protein
MAQRLDIDAHVLAYLGFDEANETDVALDESTYERNFVVTNSPSVQVARANNGRQFNGTTSFAQPLDSAPFRLTGDMSIIIWFSIDQVNSVGSFYRTILECSGPGASEAENCLYSLHISNMGEIVYRHQVAEGEYAILKTETSTVKTGRYYSLALRRITGTDGTCELLLYLDNQPLSWTTAGTIPVPVGGSEATLLLGKSQKTSDGSHWFGVLDEFSIHDIDRLYQPYLRAAYYRLTLYALFFRITAYDNVKSVGTAEMGGGERWWVYERDQSLYAIRENTLGLFSPEVQLTTTGIQTNGTIGPGGAEKPAVAYDKASDTLLIAFISSGRVYRLTASSGDAPVTQQLPLTVDTASIIKVRDTNEGVRLGTGSACRTEIREWMGGTTRGALKLGAADSIVIGRPDGSDKTLDIVRSLLPGLRSDSVGLGTIYFTGWPSFGIYIPSLGSYGVAVYSDLFGMEKLEGYVKTTVRDEIPRTFPFWPIAAETRVDGKRYYVRYLDKGGWPMANISNRIVDLLATVSFATAQDRPNNRLCLNRDGDLPQLVPLGAGGHCRTEIREWMGGTTRGSLKMVTADVLSAVGAYPALGVGAGLLTSISCTATPTAPKRVPVEVV